MGEIINPKGESSHQDPIIKGLDNGTAYNSTGKNTSLLEERKPHPCRCVNRQDQLMCDFYASERCDGSVIDRFVKEIKPQEGETSEITYQRRVIGQEEWNDISEHQWQAAFLDTCEYRRVRFGKTETIGLTEDDKISYELSRKNSILEEILNLTKQNHQLLMMDFGEQQASEITDEEIEKATDEYLAKVGNVDRMDIIRHDFIQGILWYRNRLGEKKA